MKLTITTLEIDTLVSPSLRKQDIGTEQVPVYVVLVQEYFVIAQEFLLLVDREKSKPRSLQYYTKKRERKITLVQVTLPCMNLLSVL